MMEYIINAMAFQVFFLIIYDLFFKKETFFNWNRFYLLGTSLSALVIPVIKIHQFKEVLPQDFIFSLPEVIIGSEYQLSTPSSNSDVLTLKMLWLSEIVLYTGMALAALLLLFKIIKLILIISKNPKSKMGNLYLVRLLNSRAAFSCFHYIFLGEQINEKDKASILKHEIAHVKQKHTLDLLFFEVLRVLFWFNPLVYVYQHRMTQLHEFIADRQAMKNQSKKDYYENLLSQFFQTQNISFINPFFKQSLIKKRIVMLQKTQSKQINLLKYALLIPIIIGMLIYTSCSAQKEEKEVSLTDQINQLKSAIEQKGEITSEKEQQAVKSLSAVLNKTKYAHQEGVPFSALDQTPIFPECKDEDASKQKACFSRHIAEHVNKNFNTKKADNLNLIGKQRIHVIFKINKEGSIVDIRSRAPHPELEAEAVRVIKTLPKMLPGEHQGKKVSTLYSLPIIFELKTSNKENG